MTPPGKDARDCLKCRRRFASDGPHNRLCDKCNRRNSDLSRMDLRVQEDEGEAKPRTWKYKRDK